MFSCFAPAFAGAAAVAAAGCLAVPGLKASVLFFSVLAPLDESLAQLSFFLTKSPVLLLVFFSCNSPLVRKIPVSVDEKKIST